MLGNRWRVTHAPAAGSTVVAHITNPPSLNERRHLETLWFSIHNRTGSGAAAATVTVSVRNASPAGTVIASVDHLVPASSTANVAMTNMGLFAKRGAGMAVTMDTVVASLTQKVSMAGWTEEQ
jgi:hypothetical protein